MATKEEPRRKLALVIGIGKYDCCEELQNPENDANDMSSALESIDFNVTKKLHLRRAEMQHVLIDFENSIEQDDMVLFYFAGHGIQWEVCIKVSPLKVIPNFYERFICGTFRIKII
ncbi:unnamed protein product [Rotaria sordida]|uniref:Caspase family p20 domain-containing protein n=1 Tax=Rotaria sordida TaxID=392033 RepID=A0A819UMM9_9BILA|nr:unnamed protein product [Rotaria sordida]